MKVENLTIKMLQRGVKVQSAENKLPKINEEVDVENYLIRDTKSCWCVMGYKK